MRLPAGVREIRGRAAAALFDLAGEAARGRFGAIRSGERLPACGARARPRPQGSAAAAGICASRRGLGHAVRGPPAQERTTSTTRRSAGCPPTGCRILTAASFLPRSARARERLDGCRSPRPIGCRADWNPPWKFATEHFEIQTNVPLAEAITFGRRLEAFHDLFMTLLADILGENLPLIRRFKDPKLDGRRPARDEAAPGLLLRVQGRVRRSP